MSEITFPVGRFIFGDIYKPNEQKDTITKLPKLGKDGKPILNYTIGVAIQKGSEQHWTQTPWGAEVYKEGFSAYDQMAHAPGFAWKITDGDSTIPDKNGNAPNTKPHYPGNWVVVFNTTFDITKAKWENNQPVPIYEDNAIVPGYYIQVHANVVGNGSRAKPAQTAGVYLNPQAVCLIGYGEKIVGSSVDITKVGFGQGPMPAGMSAVPPGGFNPSGVAVPPAPEGFNPATVTVPSFPPPAAPFPGAMSGSDVVQFMPPGGPFPGAPVPGMSQDVPHFPSSQPVLQPNAGFLQVPGAPVAHVMTPSAQGWTYDQLKAQGWSDDKLIQLGMMLN
jgi:hypothetical protein